MKLLEQKKIVARSHVSQTIQSNHKENRAFIPVSLVILLVTILVYYALHDPNLVLNQNYDLPEIHRKVMDLSRDSSIVNMQEKTLQKIWSINVLTLEELTQLLWLYRNTSNERLRERLGEILGLVSTSIQAYKYCDMKGEDLFDAMADEYSNELLSHLSKVGFTKDAIYSMNIEEISKIFIDIGYKHATKGRNRVRGKRVIDFPKYGSARQSHLLKAIKSITQYCDGIEKNTAFFIEMYNV